MATEIKLTYRSNSEPERMKWWGLQAKILWWKIWASIQMSVEDHHFMWEHSHYEDPAAYSLCLADIITLYLREIDSICLEVNIIL